VKDSLFRMILPRRLFGVALIVAISFMSLPAHSSIWTSQWRTTLGTLHVQNLPKEQVYGEWTNKTQKAEIRGRMQQDCTFKGHWYVVQGKASRRCGKSYYGTAMWGPLSMVFNRADLTFTGKFGYCGGKYEKNWGGQMLWSRKRGKIRKQLVLTSMMRQQCSRFD
jgi:hypothetical protein